MRYILLIIGFILLISGANLLVNGAVILSKRLRVSTLIIGLTIVAFGTSIPELFVNILASIKGNIEIAIGNVLGSNIANILLVLGLSSIISPLEVKEGTVYREIPLSLLAAILVGILANDQLIDRVNSSALTRIDGLVFLLFFIVFMYYVFSIVKEKKESMATALKESGFIRSTFFVIGGLTGVIIGAKWIVESAAQIALDLGVSQSLVGLTIVACGTSLPELATSVTAAYKKNPEIAVGNVVGSNIFNIFFILGLSTVIRPFPLERTDNIDICIMILASLLLFSAMFVGGRRLLISRWEGVVFVILYIGYIVFLTIRG